MRIKAPGRFSFGGGGGGGGVGRFVLIQFEVQIFVGATGKGLSI